MIGEIGNDEARETLMELLVIMAVADGRFDPAEEALLERIAHAENALRGRGDARSVRLFLTKNKPDAVRG